MQLLGTLNSKVVCFYYYDCHFSLLENDERKKIGKKWDKTCLLLPPSPTKKEKEKSNIQSRLFPGNCLQTHRYRLHDTRTRSIMNRNKK